MTKSVPIPREVVWLAAGLAMIPSLTAASDIEKDERIVFFPTAAHLSENGHEWVASVHGWIYEPEANSLTRKAAVAGFRKMLRSQADGTSSDIFERRVWPFLVDNERGKEIAVQVGGKMFELERSSEDGHFFGPLRLDVQTANRSAPDGRLRYLAVTDDRDTRRFEGTIHLVPPAGVSVISDIDDTIKVTEVSDRKKLVENTFFLPFRSVEGMPELYRRWADAGAEFHFVSGSPWQLYEPLAELARDTGFPPATFHLRRIRFKDFSVLSLLADPLEYKPQVIKSLMADFPQRRFILVGDSGERDPEVYAEVAAKHPDQVLRIYIRDVTAQAADSPRYKTTFAQLPREKWQLFRDPREIWEDLKPAAEQKSPPRETKKSAA